MKSITELLDQGVVFFLDRRRLLFFPERNQLCSITAEVFCLCLLADL